MRDWSVPSEVVDPECANELKSQGNMTKRTLEEIRDEAKESAKLIRGSAIGPSDPWARIDRKKALGIDTTLEEESLKSRGIERP